jgi:hypothetical protein
MIGGSKGIFVRLLGSVPFLFVLAALFAAPAHALDPGGNAWTASNAPLQANAFVAPADGNAEAVAYLGGVSSEDPNDYSRGWIFDEVRLGVLTFWQDNSETEQGIYVTGQVLFDPFVPEFNNRFLNILLRPRPHFGGNISPDGTDQIFGGVTWTIPIWRALFADASFGGTIHDGPLSGAEVSLGCRALFRESIALGLKLGPHWRVVGGIDHSSQAGLCEGENDGLTHIGGSIGYRF